ncbi:hypothetical protein [Chamaesiphon minutus]|uniref:Uncharacterized protein n=1 Tax=Chamaesiphon minutus (strain ATCC 27169 / PCC 6605) TaxID=1173020 RepID=K9UKU4_CHAP6|nr:hypothetical protein [Chamaesiphon minutus]AFY94794.1 hypothetical protein Cha6605_3824 [Chamaesiphon minutus PCC 6605]
MLNISKFPAVIFGCSAIVTASLVGFAGSAAAQTNVGNLSNGSGTNVTTTTGGSIPSTSTPGGISPATTARINTFSQNIPVLQNNVSQARAAVNQLTSVTAPPPDTSPVRFSVDKGVADLASCGCPDANAIGSTTPTTPSPELVAAREAEAKAEAELAAAKAEARQFIESVKSEKSATSRTVDTSLW